MAIFGGRVFDSAVREGITTYGPALTKTPIEIGQLEVSVWSGRGRVEDLVIGNPPGYEGAFAVRVPSATLEVSLGSILSETIVIKRVHVRDPVVQLETEEEIMNLRQIRNNIADAIGEEDPGPPEDRKKYVIEEFVLEGGQISVEDVEEAFSMRTVRLSDIGRTENGLLGEAIVQRILEAVIEEMVPVLGDAATGLVEDPEESMGAAETVVDTVQDWFGGGDEGEDESEKER